MKTVAVFLDEIFLARQRANKMYSRRAFSRDIGIPPGRFSEILHGKRNLTLRMAEIVSTNLGLSSAQKEKLISLVRSQNHLKTKTYTHRKEISNEQFSQICHWQFYALLALLEVEGGRGTKEFLSQRLGLPIHEIEEMAKILLKIGLIEVDPSGYRLLFKGTTTTQDKVSEAIQNFHGNLLGEIKKRAVRLGPAEREVQALILPMKVKNLPRAKKTIRKFMERFAAAAEKEAGDEVFCLGIQFFPLTK